MAKKLYIILFILMLGSGAFAQRNLNVGMNPVKMLRFYPNPATTTISFNFQRDYENTYTLQIYNFMGKKVYDLKNTPPNVRVGLEDFYRGIYIYQLRNKNGIIVDSGKFQVIK